MVSEKDKEKKNKQIAFITSLGIHASLFLVFFFLVAWRAPNPPLPEYGIELNFGLDTQGGGEVQPQEEVGSDQPVLDEAKVDDAKTQEEVKEADPIAEPVVSKIESPVVVKEEKKDKVVEKPKEKEAKVTPVTEKKETKQPADAAAQTKKGKEAPNQGDDPGKTGDKGNPQGKPDAKALYGTPGGGGGGDGILLSMSGWAWADQPKVPDLPDNEDGKIVFEIECDESGDIVQITTMQRGLSPRAEQLLKEEIRKNSLVRTSAGKVPERSKGTIVFVLKTK